MLMVQVTGPDHSGKSNLIAAIAKCLAKEGITVHVQGAETFNKEKLERDLSQLVSRLKTEKIVITELKTGV